MAFLQEYTMLDELGSGGFATVYKVRHNELGYIRAVRMLKENIATKEGEDPQKTPTYQKFLRECKVLLRLGNGNHPNIVHIYQPRLLDNKALVEMDYVDGLDIQHYLKQNQYFVPAEDVIRMAIQMSSALAYCHEDIYRFCMDKDFDNLKDDPKDGKKVLLDDLTRKRLIEKYKVIHNDIHSSNIMRREDGNFVLLDFGLSIEGDEVVRSSRRKNGAPEYKAPEKWDNESVLTEQSDIYSFGIVLYQYLAGRVPFPFDTKNSNETEAEYLLSKAHQNETPPSIERIRKEYFESKFKGEKYKKDYPQWLEDVILKCLSKNPKDRFRNGKELHEYIRRQTLVGNEVSGESEGKLERLKKQNEELESEVRDLQTINESLLAGKRKWKVFSFALLFALLACGGLFLYSHSSENAEKEQEIQVINTINTFNEAYENNDFETLSEVYSNNILRFHSKYNLTNEEVVDICKQYDETFAVTSKHTSVRWETLKVKRLSDDDLSVVYVEDYSIDRKDKSKYSNFVIEKHLLLDKNYRIKSIYDEQLSKSR